MTLRLLANAGAAALLTLVTVPLLGAARAGERVDYADASRPHPLSRVTPVSESTEAVIWEPLNSKHLTVLQPVAADDDWHEFMVSGTAGVRGSCNDPQYAVLWRHGKTSALPTLGGREFGVINGIDACREIFRQTPTIVVDLGGYPGNSDSVLFERNDRARSVGGSAEASTRRAAFWTESRW